MYRLQVLEKARADMQSSADWYNEQQAGIGGRFLSQVIVTLRMIEATPLHYPEKFSKEFRFANVTDFPFVVVFKVKKDIVIVNAVFHTSRNPKKFI